VGALDGFGEVSLEVGKTEVGVGVVKDRHNLFYTNM
jgi:hypothetical protein